MASKVFYIPKSQQERRDLNKKLRDEQKPSLKNTIKKIAKGAAKVIGAADKIATKKLNNFLADEKKINRIERDLFGEMDRGFKKMGPTVTNSWLNPTASVVKKKKKSKKVK